MCSPRPLLSAWITRTRPEAPPELHHGQFCIGISTATAQKASMMDISPPLSYGYNIDPDFLHQLPRTLPAERVWAVLLLFYSLLSRSTLVPAQPRPCTYPMLRLSNMCLAPAQMFQSVRRPRLMLSSAVSV